MTPALSVLLLAVALLLVPTKAAATRLVNASPGGARVSPRQSQGGVTTAEKVEISRARPRTVLLPIVAAVPVAGLLSALTGWPVALAVAVFAGWVCRRWLRRPVREPVEPLSLAAGWDLLAAGLRSGLPVPVAVRAVAVEFTGTASTALLEVAELLALGADPVSAWEPALGAPDTAELARAARRTARTGSGLAGVADDIANQARETVSEQAQARAQRAAVWVSAPLGLCFLPAFLCLGVLPVVVGMVQRMALTW